MDAHTVAPTTETAESSLEGPQRSRRSFLAGAAALLGLVAAESIANAPAASAADGDPLYLGKPNSASTETVAFASVGGAPAAFRVQNTGTSDAVQGVASAGGAGTAGYADAGVGAYGWSNQSRGVLGQANGPSTGVQGVSGPTAPAPAAKTGVFGYASQDTSAIGVLGESGVGTGVRGRSDQGTGVFAESLSGDALLVSGPGAFSRCGIVTILAGRKSILVTSVALSPKSLVLAVLQGNSSKRYVLSAVPDVANDRFTITLNKAVKSDTPVGWFVVN